jgi:hypothetical protein
MRAAAGGRPSREPLSIAVPQEAMYWWANADSTGHPLSGAHGYLLHFPADGLPPNAAF